MANASPSLATVCAVEEVEADGGRESIERSVTEEPVTLVKIPSFVCIRELDSSPLQPQELIEDQEWHIPPELPVVKITLSDGEELTHDFNAHDDAGEHFILDREEEDGDGIVLSSDDEYDDIAIAVDNDFYEEGAEEGGTILESTTTNDDEEGQRTVPETPVFSSAASAIVVQGPAKSDTRFLTSFNGSEDQDCCAHDDEEDEVDEVRIDEDDLELLQVSDDGEYDSASGGEGEGEGGDTTEDEFEQLRQRRLLSAQRSVLAPERDVCEEDAETAEFQTRLRRISSASSAGSRSSPAAAEHHMQPLVFPSDPPDMIIEEEDNLPLSPVAVAHATVAESGESQCEKINVQEYDDDEVISRLRPQRSFDRDNREAAVPEREIEEEDSACAEILNNLRRSKSSEAFLIQQRKKSGGGTPSGAIIGGGNGSLKRKSSRGLSNLEVLNEATSPTSPILLQQQDQILSTEEEEEADAEGRLEQQQHERLQRLDEQERAKLESSASSSSSSSPEHAVSLSIEAFSSTWRRKSGEDNIKRGGNINERGGGGRPLFRSLSAGSDLDNLKDLLKISDFSPSWKVGSGGGPRILSMVDLQHQNGAFSQMRHPAPSHLSDRHDHSPRMNRFLQQQQQAETMTASLQSIHRLADSVENLRDKLAAHAGMQLFQARAAAATATTTTPPSTAETQQHHRGALFAGSHPALKVANRNILCAHSETKRGEGFNFKTF